MSLQSSSNSVLSSVAEPEAPGLERGVGLLGAISTNVLNMVGIGPFLTIPLALAAMGGPQAMLGWIVGAVLSLCDGMVWAELGSAMPRSGGPYFYLLQAFGPRSFGRIVSFLFLWQAMLIGPLSIASGAVGFSEYTKYIFPSLSPWHLTMLAAGVCVLNTVLLLRDIRSISGLSIIISSIVAATVLWILVSGAMHFHAALAFDFPPHAFHLTHGFFIGLGSATLIALYDYGGYYNVCLIGEEVKDARRVIPRSILISIVFVATLYLAMNLTILGVVPWQRAMHSEAVVALFIQQIYGVAGGRVIAVLILIATFGSVFAVLLGYSRIPYAAAVDGRFFSIFTRLHPKGRYPIVAVLTMGGLSTLACVFSLNDLITGLIVIQTMLQFMGQCVAVILLRRQRFSEGTAHFKMPLYPLPALIALGGWTYIVAVSGLRYIALGILLLVLGVVAYLFRAYYASEWPFGAAK